MLIFKLISFIIEILVLFLFFFFFFSKVCHGLNSKCSSIYGSYSDEYECKAYTSHEFDFTFNCESIYREIHRLQLQQIKRKNFKQSHFCLYLNKSFGIILSNRLIMCFKKRKILLI